MTDERLYTEEKIQIEIQARTIFLFAADYGKNGIDHFLKVFIELKERLDDDFKQFVSHPIAKRGDFIKITETKTGGHEANKKYLFVGSVFKVHSMRGEDNNIVKIYHPDKKGRYLYINGRNYDWVLVDKQ